MKRWTYMVGLAAMMMSTLAVRAGAPPVDADLLEFLGSMDAEGEGWREYLERTPIERVKPPPASATPQPAKPEPVQAAPPQDAPPQDAKAKGRDPA